jgi:diguanylate cyclase (GGDEF)-like protein
MLHVPLRITHALGGKVVGYFLIAYAVAVAVSSIFLPALFGHDGLWGTANRVVLPLGIAVICFWVSQGVDDSRVRWSWRFIGVFFLLFALEQYLSPLLWGMDSHPSDGIMESSPGHGPEGHPLNTSGDGNHPPPGSSGPHQGGPPTSLTLPIFWAIMYMPLIAGLLFLMPRRLSKSAMLSAGLDALVFTLGIGLLAFQFFWGPVLFGPQGQGIAAFTIWRALANAFILFVMLSVVMGWSLERVSSTHLRILAALCLQVATGLILSLDRHSFNAFGLDLGTIMDTWTVIAWGVAALSQVRNVPQEQLARKHGWVMNLLTMRKVRMLFPYIALPIVGFLVYSEIQGLTNQIDGRFLTIIMTAGAVVVLIVIRQIVTLHDVANLTDRLSGLNDMATQLSGCQTAEEMMATGAELAIVLNGVQACILWKTGEDGLPIVMSQRGLSEVEAAVLSNSKKLPDHLKESIGASQVSVIKAADLSTIAPKSLRRSGMVVAPLLSRGTVLGSLSLWLRPLHIPDGAELRHAQAIAAQMGVALESIQRLEEVRALADQDGVTGLLNHRAVHERLRVELLRSQRFGHALAVVMIDLNGFKIFNDTYGHPAGDRVIRQVANILRDHVRAMDLVGRYGGDEFIVGLLETDADGARQVAAKLRKAIAADGFRTDDGQVIPIGASMGIACYPDDATQIEHLVALADANLYESKHCDGEPVTSKHVPNEHDGAMTLAS